MSVQIQIEEMPGYLAVSFTGSINEAWRKFALIAGHCKRANKNKLLLDFTETYGDLSLVDRYVLGDKAEIFMLFKLVKVAAVGRPEQFDSRGFGEVVARNRWVSVRTFTNVEDAKSWLLIEPAAPKKRAVGRYHAKAGPRARHLNH
jgi:hypothetical protein